MNEVPVRRPWRIHLSTALILMFAVALMMLPISSIIHEATSPNTSNSPDWCNALDVVFACSFALVILFAIGFVCEAVIFHRSARRNF